jgi:hypothetical protein
MFRRMTLSILGGALLAIAFSFSQTAIAACEERCADTQAGGLVFDSCLVDYSCPPNSACVEVNVRCYYTGVLILD